MSMELDRDPKAASAAPIRTVCVVGRDLALWLSALGLQRAFGRIGVKVLAVELPSLLPPGSAIVALPSLGALHPLLGLNEADLMRGASGMFALAQRFANWSGGKPAFLHPYDTQPVGVNNVDLLQYWVKARSRGMKVAWEEFSLGAAMAKAGRIDLSPDLSGGAPRPAWGYHFDAAHYCSLIRTQALRAGVHAIGCDRVEVEASNEQITAVDAAGQRVQADLWVDASGTAGILIGQLGEGARESWRPWLPCDRQLVASAQPLNPLPAFSQIAAFRAGWVGLFPLQDRTAVIAVYSSAHASDREVLESLPTLTGARISGAATAAGLDSGRRLKPWVGNCVAIGEAAVVTEPLDAVEPHLIQAGLSLLVSVFPTDTAMGLEARAFNQAMARHATGVRDFQAAHYRLNQRRDDPFWDLARKAQPPQDLSHKLAVFSARGRVPVYDDEAFQPSNWASILIGHGLMPRDYDPLVELVDEPDQIRHIQQTLAWIAREVKTMPDVASQLPRPFPAFGGSAFA